MIRSGVLCVFLALALAPRAANADRVLVFAAASMQTALDTIIADWRGPTEIAVSYASSAALARQIAAGAPADIFVSANLAWMDWLEDQQMIIDGSRRDVIGNDLVVIASGPGGNSSTPVTPKTDFADGRIAMGLVDAVPAGIYGKAALQSLGIWARVAPQVVQADNARAALAFVARGEVARAIVYRSDATADPRVHVTAVFPEGSHQEIIYPAALIVPEKNPQAAEFLDHLSGPEARKLFVDAGFVVLEGETK